MPRVDRGSGQVRQDEPDAQPPAVEAWYQNDEGHDHDQSQAEKVAAGSEPMLGVTEDPVQLDRQRYEQQAR
jgi:hypothetical protein